MKSWEIHVLKIIGTNIVIFRHELMNLAQGNFLKEKLEMKKGYENIKKNPIGDKIHCGTT